MSLKAANPPVKRYIRRFSVAMSLYVVLIMAVSLGFRLFHFEGPAAWALAVLPALAILATIAVMGLYLKEETDEFQRNVMVESTLWGLGITLSITSVWGMLEMYVDAPRLPAFLAFPIWCGAMGVAQPLVRRRFR